MWPTSKDTDGDFYEQYQSKKLGENEKYIFMLPTSGDGTAYYFPQFMPKLELVGKIIKSFSTFTPLKTNITYKNDQYEFSLAFPTS